MQKLHKPSTQKQSAPSSLLGSQGLTEQWQCKYIVNDSPPKTCRPAHLWSTASSWLPEGSNVVVDKCHWRRWREYWLSSFITTWEL